MMATSNPYMAAHMHSSPHYTHHQPQQWPMRTALPSYTAPTMSNGNSSMSRGTSSSPSSSQPMMIATGKKRKRLQRACVACHKAKRRCDGGLPCSNCDFSGRTCAYSDSQGKAVPPTKRTLRPSEAAIQEQQLHQYHPQPSPSLHSQHLQQVTSAAAPSHHGPRSMQGYSMHTLNTSPTMPPSMSIRTSSHSPPLNGYAMSPTDNHSSSSSSRRVSEPNPEVRRELLLVFFSKVHPWSCVLDEISLLRDLSSMSASPAILFAIYALSARHAHRNAGNAVRYAHLVDDVGDGAAYAAEARRVLQTENPVTGMSALDGDLSLDTRQALCLLACFEFESGRYERAASYMQLCSKHVTALRRASGPENEPSERHEGSQQRQLSKRLTCIVAVLDICISIACGRAPLLRTWDLEFAINAIKGPSSGRSNEGSSNDDPITNALSQLLSITLVLSNALDIHRRAKSAVPSTAEVTVLEADTQRNVHACEQFLQRWADQLCDRLRFDEESLYAVSNSLLTAQQGSHNNDNGWSPALALTWCAIHMFAEAATLLLRDAVDNDLPLAAAQNMAMILERMNVRSFSSPVSAFAIAMLKSSSLAVEAQQQRNGTGSSSDARSWSDLYRTAGGLQAEARLDSVGMNEAQAWLAMGGIEFVTPSSRIMRPSWSTSPKRAGAMHQRSPSFLSATNGATSSSSMRPSSSSAAGLNGSGLAIDSSASRTSVSPMQSSTALSTNGISSLKSRHSSTSSTTASSTSVMTAQQSNHHLPPLVGLNGSSNQSSSTHMLPPLRFHSPEEPSQHKWSTGSADNKARNAPLTSPHTLFERPRA